MAESSREIVNPAAGCEKDGLKSMTAVDSVSIFVVAQAAAFWNSWVALSRGIGSEVIISGAVKITARKSCARCSLANLESKQRKTTFCQAAEFAW